MEGYHSCDDQDIVRSLLMLHIFECALHSQGWPEDDTSCREYYYQALQVLEYAGDAEPAADA